MSVIDAIYASELSAEKLHELGDRGNVLIEQLAMRYPVKCQLFGSCGERLAVWTLGERNDETAYGRESIEDRWERSAAGVTLLLTDSRGRIAEVVLVVGPREALQSQQLRGEKTVSEYRPPNDQPENPGMGPWVQPRAPELVLPAGTVEAPAPPFAPGSVRHPTGLPDK
jgi:hypothetical protein